MTETKTPDVKPTPPEPPKEQTPAPSKLFQVTFKCDGCDKLGEARIQRSGTILRPKDWFERMDEKGYQIACSRECVASVAAATGRSAAILPV